MWFARGVQSAIFYYVACTPCVEADYKKKRRKEAGRIQKQREALELEQPGIIQQPVPFQTNKYWAEEITAGPGPPSGWTGHDRNPSARTPSKKTSGSKVKYQSALANDTKFNPASGTTGLPSANVVTAQQEHTTKDTIKDSLKAAISPENWNWIRHERPDEILWGYEPLTRILKGKGREESTSDGATLSPTPGRHRSRTGDSKVSNTSKDYTYISRNPEINELHPPIVSKLPATRDEVAWMLQPPPPAEVMEGKIHPDHAPLPPRPPMPEQSEAPVSEQYQKSPPKQRKRRTRSRPPAIVISNDPSLSSTDSPASSRASSLSRTRTPSSRPTSKSTPHTPKGTPPRHTRPPLAAIMSFDGHHMIPRATSPWTRKSSETNDLHTPPEWEFLMTEMYGAGLDRKVEYEAPGGPVSGRSAMRASWHGHERRWSEI